MHPPRAPAAEARTWPIQLVARSLSRAHAFGRSVATLEIAPYLALGCELRPEQATGERSARYELVVRNDGNRTASAVLTAGDPAQALTFDFRPPGLELPAGAAQPVELKVAARPPPGAAPREHRFAVHATADGATTGATGSFVQSAAEARGLQRRGGQLALRLLLTLLAGALLIGGSFATWTAASQTGACSKGSADSCLDYADLVNTVSGSNVLATAPDNLPGALYLVGSAGFVTIVLGVLALAGARRGRSTWLAGILAVTFLVVVAIQTDASSGIAIPLLGGFLAIAAGFLPVVFREA